MKSSDRYRFNFKRLWGKTKDPEKSSSRRLGLHYDGCIHCRLRFSKKTIFTISHIDGHLPKGLPPGNERRRYLYFEYVCPLGRGFKPLTIIEAILVRKVTDHRPWNETSIVSDLRTDEFDCGDFGRPRVKIFITG